MSEAPLSVSRYKRYILKRSSLKESNKWRGKTMNLSGPACSLLLAKTNDNAFCSSNKEPIHMPSDSLHNNAPTHGQEVCG